jgi:hypothetical protein
MEAGAEFGTEPESEAKVESETAPGTESDSKTETDAETCRSLLAPAAFRWLCLLALPLPPSRHRSVPRCTAWYVTSQTFYRTPQSQMARRLLQDSS